MLGAPREKRRTNQSGSCLILTRMKVCHFKKSKMPRWICARLKKLGMKSFLKTTGGKGLHVVLPFQKGPSWEEVRAFSEAMAGLMAEDAPELYTVNSRKAARKGKIYIDYLRNNKAASAIAPYPTRAKPVAPIALPLAWEELKQSKTPNQFMPKKFSDWRQRVCHDPWKDLSKLKQKLKL